MLISGCTDVGRPTELIGGYFVTSFHQTRATGVHPSPHMLVRQRFFFHKKTKFTVNNSLIITHMAVIAHLHNSLIMIFFATGYRSAGGKRELIEKDYCLHSSTPLLHSLIKAF
jgi:hypothetical protein